MSTHFDKPTTGARIETLRNDTLSVGVAPHLGGSLAWFRMNGQDLTRPLPAQSQYGDHPERLGSGFVLAPYSNRIANGSFQWLGETVRLRRNFGGHPHSLHGFGWQRPWTCEHLSTDSLRLTLHHEPDDDWPWPCTLIQDLQLDNHTLTQQLSLTHRGDRPMPAGLGWHPYFIRTPDLTLQFQAHRVWTMNDDHLPDRPVRIPNKWNYSTSRPVGWPGLDHCFSGWNDQATLTWPNKGVKLTLHCPDPMGHLVVFTPEQADFIAVEPTTHVNNAHNLYDPTAQGLRILSPGETMSRKFTMTVEAVQP